MITGTDTGVGKTVVAAALLLALREGGRRVVGFKPVETGVGASEPSDSDLLAWASGADEPDARPLLRLTEPLAPAVAAERAGLALDPRAVEERVRILRDRGYSVLVEGAGGVQAPLAWGYTALDLAERLSLPAVVVARAGLGTLNHVVLTVDALRLRGVTVRAVVLNGFADPPDLAQATNPAALARLLPGLGVRILPRLASQDPRDVARSLSALLEGEIEGLC